MGVACGGAANLAQTPDGRPSGRPHGHDEDEGCDEELPLVARVGPGH